MLAMVNMEDCLNLSFESQSEPYIDKKNKKPCDYVRFDDDA